MTSPIFWKMNLLHLYFRKLGEDHQISGKRLAEMLMLSCPDDYIGFIVVMVSLDTDTGEELVLDCQTVLGSFLTYILWFHVLMAFYIPYLTNVQLLTLKLDSIDFICSR